MTTPVGHWWAGVTTTTRVPVAASASTSMPPRVDRDRHQPQAGPFHGEIVVQDARLLDGDTGEPALGEGAQHQTEALGVPGADDHVARVGDRATDPTDVRGDDLAEQFDTLRIAVAGRRDRRLPAGLAECPLPVAHREAAEVGDPVAEVDVEPSRRGGEARHRRGCHPARGDPGRRSGTAVEVALRLELGVAVDHQPAGDAELGGQLAR